MHLSAATVKLDVVVKISEKEFARLCDGLAADREIVIKHNPIGTADETLLWMLLGILGTYLSLTELETPCFTGRPDAATYRRAIEFVLQQRSDVPFNAAPHIDRLLSNEK